jgi:hypothetical protein
MRVRHRIPSIFTLSMVDVLCCALGCVILLWLAAETQKGEEIEEQAKESAARLFELQSKHDGVETELRAARGSYQEATARIADAEGRIQSLTEEQKALQGTLTARANAASNLKAKLQASAKRVAFLDKEAKDAKAKWTAEQSRADKLDGALGKAEVLMRSLNKELVSAKASYEAQREQTSSLEREIGRRSKELAALTKNLNDLAAARKGLQSELAGRDKELAIARGYKDKWVAAEGRLKILEKDLLENTKALTDAKGYKDKWVESEARLKKMDEQLKERTAALDEANDFKSKWMTADARLKNLEKSLLRKSASLAELTKTVDALREERARWKTTGETRFAGIALTGKRVVFLVDISGSMEMLDDDTPAPLKWTEVKNTVARIMRSLPELEKYQVITFNTSVAYPLGEKGQWLNYNAKKSPEETLAALKKVKPRSGTNLYIALEAAFKMRSQGMDTVYLLSDGLPNNGPGLKSGGPKLTEVQRGTILGKHIRDILKTKWNQAELRRSRVRINSIGFFYESPDLGAFLWALSRENDGSFVGMSKP